MISTDLSVVGRRGFLQQIAVLPTLGSLAALPVTCSTLSTLGEKLDATHRAKAALEASHDHDDEWERLYEIHWDLREKINSLPAKTLSALHVKARAADYALHYDPQTENEGPGSFVDLSRSIIADIQRLAREA